MGRTFWIAFGGFNQVWFAFMVPQLFFLLYRGGGDLLGIEAALGWSGAATVSPAVAWLIDVALLLQFGLWHSLFLIPSVQRRIQRAVPRELYGSLYAFIASTSVLLVCWFWQPLPGVVYAAEGGLAWMLLGAFLASWVLLVYSISYTGLGWQNGLTPWRAYIRNEKPPRRDMVTTGLYAWLRHPIYLSFLGLIWFTPRMTTEHLLMAAVWSVYIYAGSVHKDRRLLFYLGDGYREYMERVPGYPLVFWGPLARATPREVVGSFRSEPEASATESTSRR